MLCAKTDLAVCYWYLISQLLLHLKVKVKVAAVWNTYMYRYLLWIFHKAVRNSIKVNRDMLLAQTTKHLPPHRANDSTLNFLTLTSGRMRINLYAKFPCTDPKMTAIIQIYILSPAKIMTINHRAVMAVNNYTVSSQWGVSLGKACDPLTAK